MDLLDIIPNKEETLELLVNKLEEFTENKNVSILYLWKEAMEDVK